MKLVNLTVASIASLLLTIGCESKVEQCNSMIDVVNTGASALTNLSAVNYNNNEAAQKQLNKTIETLQTTSEKLKALELKDEKLRDYADKYVQMLQDVKAEMTALKGHLADAVKLQEAQEQIEKLCSDEKRAEMCQKTAEVATQVPERLSDKSAVDAWAKKMKGLQIEDKKLDKATSDMLQAVKTMATTTTEGKTFEEQVMSRVKALEEAADRESPLVDSLNSYCQS